jgi:uncharacterized protein
MRLRKLQILLILSCWTADAAQGLPADAAFRDGLSAYNSGDYARARSIWEPLAQNEDAASQAGLGFMYHRGFGMAVDDKKAAFWLRKAAEHGQPEGQMLLGSLYFYGQGVVQSYVQAFAWCDLAQDNGNADAGMCRDSALQSLVSKRDVKAAFDASLELHHRFRAKH